MQAKDTRTAFAKHGKAGAATSLPGRMDHVATQREDRIARIAALRRIVTSNFLDQAAGLLAGRFWARSSIRSREYLIQTVDWLIGMAQRGPVPTVALGNKPKRAIRTKSVGHPGGKKRLAPKKAVREPV